MNPHDKAIEMAANAIGCEIGGTQDWKEIARAAVVAFLSNHEPTLAMLQSPHPESDRRARLYRRMRDALIRELEDVKMKPTKEDEEEADRWQDDRADAILQGKIKARDAYLAGVLAERERCAKVAEDDADGLEDMLLVPDGPTQADEEAADKYYKARRRSPDRVNPCEHEAFLDGILHERERAAKVAETLMGPGDTPLEVGGRAAGKAIAAKIRSGK